MQSLAPAQAACYSAMHMCINSYSSARFVATVRNSATFVATVRRSVRFVLYAVQLGSLLVYSGLTTCGLAATVHLHA